MKHRTRVGRAPATEEQGADLTGYARADVAPGRDGRPADWPQRLQAACAGAGVRTVFQPIAAVGAADPAGYEALTRFGGGGASPLPWFGAARRHGCVAELEAAALRTALSARASLPSGCFLTVNVSPDLLRSPVIRAVWREQGDLTGVVVELTEQAPIESYRALEPDLDALRAAGALLAVDDAGAGYAGLRHVLALRPAIVKLDASLVTGLDRDPAKRALIDMVATFASRIEASVLAEGVERARELHALVALGVPLVQGNFLGEPSSSWTGLSAHAAAMLCSRAGRRARRELRSVPAPR
jgi:EAL domain-containing protein (putative c-di-GMP-specific phosphodiesterase class I)